ncbi:MAG: glycosyltransferase [bacterium]
MNTYNPLVTIVIPVYKGANYIGEAIESALAQTYKNIEIIVVNDGSPDNGATAEAVMKYADRVTYYEKENGGISSALNYVAKRMNGEWLSWLSHDDLYYPRKIELQIILLNAIIAENDTTNIQSYVLYGAGDMIDCVGKKLPYPKFSLHNNMSNEELVVENIHRNQFMGCTFLISKQCFNDIGYFNENLRTISDYDYWYRLLFAGYHFRCLTDIIISNRMHKDQLTHILTETGIKESNIFHEWVIDRLYINQYCQKSALLYLLLGKYMSQKGIPAADKAYQRALQLAENRNSIRMNIFSAKASGAIVYLWKSNLKRLYLALFIKRK